MGGLFRTFLSCAVIMQWWWYTLRFSSLQRFHITFVQTDFPFSSVKGHLKATAHRDALYSCVLLTLGQQFEEEPYMVLWSCVHILLGFKKMGGSTSWNDYYHHVLAWSSYNTCALFVPHASKSIKVISVASQSRCTALASTRCPENPYESVTYLYLLFVIGFRTHYLVPVDAENNHVKLTKLIDRRAPAEPVRILAIWQKKRVSEMESMDKARQGRPNTKQKCV